MKLKRLQSDKGFTIVELMIALSILSTLLVTASVVMIEVGSLYVKGVNSANLQNTNRAVVADISSALQFSGDEPLTCSSTSSPCPHIYNGNLSVDSRCIGTTRYSYVLNREQGTDQGLSPAVTTKRVLWRDTMINNGSCPPLDISSVGNPFDAVDPTGNGYNMLADHMRLTSFSVNENPAGVFAIDIEMAFGDSDLVVPNGSGGYACSGATGTQFCGISSISTTVTKRVY